jgi:hypothetical protein
MTTEKKLKYSYSNVIQQYYGSYGWEDVSEYDAKSNGLSIDKETRELLKHDLKEYRLTGYPTRLIFRRIKTNLN